MMAYTSEDLATLKAAYARGQLRIKTSDGAEVEFASGNDLRSRIAQIESELSAGVVVVPQKSGRSRQTVYNKAL